MLFPTVTFAIFFMIVLPLSWLLMRSGALWRPFIIAASFVFYAGWDWRFCFLLAFSIAWNQVFATAIHRRRDPRARKQLLVGRARRQPRAPRLLQVLRLLRHLDEQPVRARRASTCRSRRRSILLPVGISFFTFQAISYVVDVYRGDFAPVGARDVRGLPVVLPPPRRRPDRAARRVHPAARPRRATRATSTRRGRSSSSAPGSSRRS